MSEEFEYFPENTPNPTGKYTQPKEYTVENIGNGYPNKIASTQTKKMRGAGAATKGTKYSKNSQV